MGRFADLMFPVRCVGCRRACRGGLCEGCIEGLTYLAPNACERCGGPAASAIPTCRECRLAGYQFDRACQSVGFHTIVREQIHRFKYGGEHVRVGPLTEIALRSLSETKKSSAFCWIPADPQRLWTKGFDHARLLAEGVADASGGVALRLLDRVGSSQAQVRLPTGERKRNQLGTMRAALPVPEEVFVVDDVFTTGATASEAARALKESGARRVTIIAVARSGNSPLLHNVSQAFRASP